MGTTPDLLSASSRKALMALSSSFTSLISAPTSDSNEASFSKTEMTLPVIRSRELDDRDLVESNRTGSFSTERPRLSLMNVCISLVGDTKAFPLWKLRPLVGSLVKQFDNYGPNHLTNCKSLMVSNGNKLRIGKGKLVHSLPTLDRKKPLFL
ncbi:hypothetical protein V6N12_036607 [Hibiscus sabdariffa]|uniref:Uncharacterized protein n=1 Tax=Hibiscus sabdariffa TaxID=183260 RepID=A0ABR2ET19_9ROSI